jgi:hypothetical protein
VLTPLQIEAFRLAKEMRAFLGELGSRPMVIKDGFAGDITSHLAAQHDAERPWELKLKSGYRTRFAKRVDGHRPQGLLVRLLRPWLGSGGRFSGCDPG